jgi:hypothetical protein
MESKHKKTVQEAKVEAGRKQNGFFAEKRQPQRSVNKAPTNALDNLNDIFAGLDMSNNPYYVEPETTAQTLARLAGENSASRSTTEYMWDALKADVGNIYESAKDWAKNPISYLAKSQVASLQGKLALLSNAVEAVDVFTGKYQLPTQTLDSETRRMVSARTAVTLAEQTALFAAGAGIGALGRMGTFSRTAQLGEGLGVERLAINASSPSEIAWGYGNLSSRQANILESLQKPGQYSQLYKSDVNLTDLAALTAHTGDEFALFTLGSRRIVVRGTSSRLEIGAGLSNKLISQEWRWSVHTHPGLSDRVLMASGFPGDRSTLQLLNQERSLILNSAGRRSIFDLENDYAITHDSHRSTLRPGY